MYKWWACKHINGQIMVKRYYFPSDLQSADESDFVVERTEAYEAQDKKEAVLIATGLLKGGDTT